MAIALLLIVWLARAGAASAAGGACVGDCKGIGRVDISDLIVGVNIALGVMPVSACRAFVNAAGELDIAQLVAGVHNALDGCDPPRFVDNGDGTITDTETGLMWEKKVGIGAGVDLGNLHAADNAYPWSGRCMHRSDVCQPDAAAAAACQQVAEGPLDGCTLCPDVGNPCKVGGADGETTVWSWLVQLNASGFAGFSDWRIPTIAELESIVDYMTTFPAVDGALHGAQCGPTCLDVNSPACSCTQFAIYNQQLGPYWSATAANLPFVEWWSIAFAGGGATYGGNLGGLPLDAFVRAVRGGGTKPMPRFVDNGDATVTDRQTGLMWEQKDAAGGLHDANSVYTWAGLCSAASGVAVGGVLCQPNAAAAAACARGAQLDRGPCDPACEASSGRTCDLDPCGTCHPDQGICLGDPGQSVGAITTVWDWLAQLNAARFAGHADWRLPTQAELATIIDYGAMNPALHDAFGWSTCQNRCSPTCSCGALDEWSATTASNCPSLAWLVDFSDGSTFDLDKPAIAAARAVRDAAP